MRKSNYSVIIGVLATIGAACWYDAQIDLEDGWWRSAPPSGTPSAVPPKAVEVKTVATPSETALEPRVRSGVRLER